MIDYKFYLLLFLSANSCLLAQEIAFEHSEKIERILVDYENHIFLGTEGNICAFDGNKLRFCSSSLEEKITNAIIIDTHKKIISTDTSIYIFHHQEITKTVHLPSHITTLAFQDSLLFVGTAGQGVFVYHLIKEDLFLIPTVKDFFINDLEVFNDELWVALDNGVERLSTSTLKSIAHYDFEENIIAHLQLIDEENILAFSQFGSIYQLSGEGELVNESNESTSAILKTTSNLGSTYVLTKKACFYLDKNLHLSLFSKENYTDLLVHENLLFLAKDDELIQFDITQKLLTVSKDNYALFLDKNDLLWTGGNGHILCLNKDTIVQTIILPAVAAEIKVTALCVTTNEVYAGTLGDGLYVFDKKGKLLNHLMVTEDENQKNIIQIKEKNGLIWVAYLNGIVTIDPVSKIIKNDFESLIGSNYLYCFYPVSQNEIYVGTSARGIIHIKDGQAKTLLKKATIYSLVEHENSLIVATEDAGLYAISLDSQKENNVYSIANFNEVLNIIPIEQKLLIATTKNVFLYDEQTKTKCTLPKLTNSEMYLNAAILSASNLYIGYDDGILCLDKSRLLALKDLSLRLEAPKLFEEPLKNERHQFKYNENTFSFSYHSNNYYQSSNTFYQYRMLGVDSLWQPSNQTVVNYFDLQPGQYIFEVASGVYAPFEPINTQRYAIVIKPPFWKRPWFILLSTGCLLFTFYYFVKRRESRLLAKEQMKQAKLRFELQQLKSQVNPHFLFNSLNSLIGLIEEDSDAAAAAAEKMSNLYRNILQYQDIEKISLEEELTLARQYFDIHKLRYYDLITIEVSDYSLKEDQCLVPLSCQFLIENALKHNTISKKNKLTITITVEDDYVIVSNNLTTKPQGVASTNTGLVNLSKRYQHLANKEMKIEQNNQFFKVKLPVIYA